MDYGRNMSRKFHTEPTVWALVCGLISKRWCLIIMCCVTSHVLPWVFELLEEDDESCTRASDGPDAASMIFVVAVASALADLNLYPRYYRSPPAAVLMIYDIIVSVVITRWALWIAWQPLRSLVHSVARSLERRCAKATAPPGWGSRKRTRDAMWAVVCDAAAPLPAASRFADGVLLLLAIAFYGAVLHATELLPRISDYYEDWSHARQYLALERCRRLLHPQRPILREEIRTP